MSCSTFVWAEKPVGTLFAPCSDGRQRKCDAWVGRWNVGAGDREEKSAGIDASERGACEVCGITVGKISRNECPLWNRGSRLPTNGTLCRRQHWRVGGRLPETSPARQFFFGVSFLNTCCKTIRPPPATAGRFPCRVGEIHRELVFLTQTHATDGWLSPPFPPFLHRSPASQTGGCKILGETSAGEDFMAGADLSGQG